MTFDGPMVMRVLNHPGDQHKQQHEQKDHEHDQLDRPVSSQGDAFQAPTRPAVPHRASAATAPGDPGLKFEC
jgi:hypothetical protein